ncbi:unnamed protein product [Sphagnum balticum]
MSHLGQPPADLVRVQLLVEKFTKRVLYMEAGKDFVDLLFSFLMLPTGTVIKLISEGLDEWPVGAISNIFRSIDKLNASVMNVSCKDILLSPQPASGHFASSLLRIQGVTSCERAYYKCNNYHCAELKTQAIMTRKHGHPCASCRNPMTKESTESQDFLAAESRFKPAGAVYVKENTTFMITYEMEIYSTSTIKSIVLLNKL